MSLCCWVVFISSQTHRTKCTSQKKIIFIPKNLSLVSVILSISGFLFWRYKDYLSHPDLLYLCHSSPCVIESVHAPPLTWIPALGQTFCGLFLLDFRRSEAIASVLVLSWLMKVDAQLREESITETGRNAVRILLLHIWARLNAAGGLQHHCSESYWSHPKTHHDDIWTTENILHR